METVVSDKLILMSEQREVELDRYKRAYAEKMGHAPVINENWSLEDVIFLIEELEKQD